MPTDGSRTTVRVDRDGVKIVRTSAIRPGVWLLVALMVVIAVGAVMLGGAARDGAPRSTPARSGDSQVAAAAGADARAHAPVPAAPITRSERPIVASRASDLPKRSAAAEPGSPSASTDGGGEKTEPSGIALFPPMGTDPIKRGIVVPDDFELPPGYVRHHQVTDDGVPLPPILMFHPDYQPVDEHGEPIAIPADRVVPPEMAPPGLAIQMLEVPESAEPAAEPEPDR